MRFDFCLAPDAPGWADSVVELDGVVVRMSVGWSSDAMGDLLNALVVLLNGGRDARCLWEMEPGQWVWDIWRPDATDVRVQLVFHKDAYGSLQSDFAPQTVAEAVLPLARFVEAIAAGARRCFDEVGPEGFVRTWREYPFPVLQLQVLEAWIGAQATAPMYELPEE